MVSIPFIEPKLHILLYTCVSNLKENQSVCPELAPVANHISVCDLLFLFVQHKR